MDVRFFKEWYSICLHDLPKVTQTIVNDLVFVFEAFITLINGINKVINEDLTPVSLPKVCKKYLGMNKLVID